MRSLAEHCVNSRITHPEDHLLVMFAGDGTILDMGHVVSHVLNEFDPVHGTHLFYGLRAEDVDVHENEIETLLDRRRLLAATREEVLACTAVVAGRPGRSSWRRPYGVVLEVIRWFQIQPRTSVALNTSQPRTLRDATLRRLTYTRLTRPNNPSGHPNAWTHAARTHKRRSPRSAPTSTPPCLTTNCGTGGNRPNAWVRPAGTGGHTGPDRAAGTTVRLKRRGVTGPMSVSVDH
jgi:hypothetical protein